MALGRGLASLIPNRRKEADDAVEEIDSMEFLNAEPAAEAVEAEEAQEPAIGIPVIEDEGETEDVVALDQVQADEEVEVEAEDAEIPVVPETEEESHEEVAEEIAEETTEDATDTGMVDKMEPEVAVEAETTQEESGDDTTETGDALENVFDDFEQLEQTDDVPMPLKPAVTPLELDPEADADLINLAHAAARHTEEVHQPKARVAQTAPERKIQTAKKEEVVEDKWDKHEGQVQHLAIGDIRINPLQPRRNFDPAELAELKESIDQHGILQPLVVRRVDDAYELIAGERRLRAAKELGWTKLPVVVRRDVAGDQTRLVYALIENIQRENLNPVELALAYQQLHDEYGLSHEEIGQRMGKSRVSVTNSMRILQLPAEVQRGLVESKISPGHARAILMIPDEEKQIRFYQHLLDEGLTVRKAETRARRIQRTMGVHDPMRQKRRRNRHPLAQKYAPLLEERFATDVAVAFNEEKNRFEVMLKAYSAAEFEQLAGRLLGTVEMPDLTRDDDPTEE